MHPFLLHALVATSLTQGAQNDQVTDLAKRVQSLEARLEALTAAEAQRDELAEELNAALDALAEAELGGAIGNSLVGFDPETTEAWKGLAARRLAPRAAKPYGTEGVSIGGYGEYLGEILRGSDGDNIDALRWVMYLGYRFSERWLFNSEIEIEHGTTGAASATTSSSGAASLEFGYIDYLATNTTVLRAGLVLVPMGFINERHEPTTFFAAARPETEQRIIPATWRASGIGAYGEVAGFAWTGYLLNGLNGTQFDANGLRSGRQSGNRASIDEVAFAARVDYVNIPGVTAGASVYFGDAGVNLPEDLSTMILDVHAEWNEGPWSMRALYAMSDVDDTAAFNTRTGENLAAGMTGWYVEAGFDLLSLTNAPADQSLSLYVRHEDLDTQADLAAGFSPSGGIVDTFTTVGLNYKPVSQVVLKTDYTFRDEGDDAIRLLVGYAF